ncbi:MAG: AI-2E family transporter, partial [Alphaproteobacteria bacterium]
LGVVFPVGLALVQFGATGAAITTLVGLTIAQLIVGALIEPRLMGQTLNLSPFVILVMLTVWTGLWGVAGALLAIPITAILVIILSEFDGTRPIAVLLTRSGRIPRRGGKARAKR